MTRKNVILIVFQLLVCLSAWSQQKNDPKKIVAKDTIGLSSKINPLAPARAGFYSAVLPGLGQAYNKKYWKIPIVYGAIGSGLYLYVINDRLYKQFRNDYKSRLAGSGTAYPQLSDDVIITVQQGYRRNRDLSLLFTLAMYALNVLDANVDAHLMQFNVNTKLSVAPEIITNPNDFRQNAGIALRLNF